MNHLKKHLKKRNDFLLVLIFLLVIACTDPKKEDEFKVRINGSELTEEKFSEHMLKDANKNRYESEALNDFIETELLYLEAHSIGIENNPDYIEITKESNKKLAAAFFLDHYFSNNEIYVSEEGLANYYKEYSNDFLVEDAAFVFNEISFRDETKAILFRNSLIETDWSRSVTAFTNDQDVNFIAADIFRRELQIGDDRLMKIIQNLNIGEISIILEFGYKDYRVYQLLWKYSAGDLPELKHIRKDITAHYKYYMKKAAYNSLIKELYSKYNVEFPND